MRKRTITAAVLLALAVAGEANAAGLYVTDRGVRPLGRGGAFVAGADDLGAIWYNPAGIVDAPSSLLFDGAWLHYSADYTRQQLTTSAQGTTFTQTFPQVTGTTPILPIPTIAGSYRFGDRQQYAIAAGLFAPMAALITFPATITGADGSQVPSPQRYNLISLKGSLLVETGLWFAYKPIEELRIGLGVQALFGSFNTTVDFSACPQDNLVCAAEDPSYDAYSQLKVGPIFAPSANAGVTYVPMEELRVGASFQAPFWINAPATADLALPNAAVFDKADQQGNQAQVSFELPAVLRLGVEVRPIQDVEHDLRIELAYVREFWSEQQSLNLTPKNIQLYNVQGFPNPFRVATTISIPRGGQDSNSIRLGAEYKFPLGPIKTQPRIGVAYETSGIQEAYVSPFTVDSNKILASIGGSLYIGEHWRLDGLLSHVFINDVTVTPQEAAVPRVNPVKGNPVQLPGVNGGTYSSRADVIGGGLQYTF